ncbi:MAG: hypothetical protein E7473_12010, partial [Ruminococcaceae bacterium]|nr:hypothetical protein [Oscillospiraceae bacterium]
MRFRFYRLILLIVLVSAMCLNIVGCGEGEASTTDDTKVYLNMNTEYHIPNTLPDGEGKGAKVILLLGQSNATGCSINSYLKENIGESAYKRYEEGFGSVLIN